MKTSSKHTLCVHEGTAFDQATRGVNTPVYTSSSFAYLDTDARAYPRYFNTPNQDAIAKKLAALEGAEDGIFFSSGMAAISAILFSFLKQGDHVLFQKGLYGGTTHMVTTELERFGISYSFTDGNDAADFKKGILPATRLLYIETPSNPLLGITDIAAVAEIGKKRKIPTAIDNTFASPINQNPHLLGIDMVMHSATKYIGGHSDLCAGAVVSSKELIDRIRRTALNLGGSLNAQTCALIERSMKTMALRVERQNENALKTAEALSVQAGIGKVYYPGLASHHGHDIAIKQMSGFGGMVSIELKNADPVVFQKKLTMIRPSMSLGGVDTIICSPVLTSHRHLSSAERLREGITEKTLRLSVGIEDPSDIIGDCIQALGS